MYTVQILPRPPRPVLVMMDGAIVSGTRLFLLYSRPLDTASIPLASVFTVTVGGVPNTVTEVQIRPPTLPGDDDLRVPPGTSQVVVLELASRVNFEQMVRLAYMRPTDNPLREQSADGRGNRADPLTNRQVTNRTPQPPARPGIRGDIDRPNNFQLVLTLGVDTSDLFFALFQPSEAGRPVNIAGFTVVNDLTGEPIAFTSAEGGTNTQTPGTLTSTISDTVTLSFFEVNNVLSSTASYTVKYTLPDSSDPLYPRRLRAVDENRNPAIDALEFTRSTDRMPPTVDSVAITSTTGPYAEGEVIEVTVTFNEVVGVNENINDMPQIPLLLGTGTTFTPVEARYTPGTANRQAAPRPMFSQTLVFSYTVEAGDTDTDGVSITANALTDALDAASGIIQDPAGNDAVSTFADGVVSLEGDVVTAELAHIVDTTAPTVNSVAITSTTGPYAQDEVIEVSVTFDEVVGVNETTIGIPQIPLQLDAGTTVQALYTAGTANREGFDFSETLVFSYTVQPGDTDTDGVSIAANALADALTTTPSIIQDPAGNNAVLSHGEVLAAPAHIVDTTPPALIAMPNGATVNGATLTLTYDEPLDDSSMPSNTDYTVTVSPGTAPTVDIDTVAINNQIVTLTLSTPVSSDQTVRLTYTVPGSNPIQDLAGNDAAALNIQVTNNTPPPQISIAADTSGPVSEGTTVSFTVTATAVVEPASDLPVTVNVGQIGDFLSGAPGEQTVTILANQSTVSLTVVTVDDDVDEEDGSVTATVTAGAGYTVGADNTASVMVTDDDDAGVTVTETDSTTVAEPSGTDTYTVVLNTEPTADVTITPTSDDTSVAMVSAALTFTTTNWNMEQTVTVTVVDDDIDSDRTTTVNHAATSTDTNYEAGSMVGSNIASVTVTVMDNDTAGVTVTETDGDTTVAEPSGTDTYTVVLTTQPTGDVTITPASDDTLVAMVSGVLTFTTTDWNMEQTVTVTVVDDNIDNTGNERTTTVTHLAASTDGNYERFTVDSVAVTATDDDAAPTNITLSLNPSNVREDAGNAAITVTATLEGGTTRDADTVVMLSTANGTATEGTDYTASTATLTIQRGTASADMTLTIPITNDGIDEEDNETLLVGGTTTVLLLPVAGATLTINDIDPLPTLAIDSLPVNEGNSGPVPLSYTVTLTGQTARTVMVDYADADTGTATSDGTDYDTITGGTLTFTPGTTIQNIGVTVRGDTIDEGDETFVVRLSNPTNAMITTADGTGTITDDDTVGVTVSQSMVTVTEEDGSGRTATYTLVLNTQPTAEVTITPASDDTSVAMVSDALTFTTMNWNTPQTVTVTGVDDDIDSDRTTSVTHPAASSDSGYDMVTIASVTVTVTNDDDAGVTVSDSALTVAPEDGGTATYTVVLDTQPTAEVTITPASDDTSVAMVSGALTFTTMNWNTPQTVTVTGVNDDLDNTGDQRITTVTHAATSSDVDYEGEPVDPVMVTATDDDGPPSLAIDSLTVTEGADGDTVTLSYMVTLTGGTERQVTVEYADADGGTATSGTDYDTITGGTLTFTPGTTTQNIDVTVTGDNIDEENETVVVRLSMPDNAMITTADGTGTITDDDTAGVTVSGTMVTVDEAGGMADYTVVLDTQPTDEVTITPASDDTSVAMVSGALTFTTMNWNTAQTVTVTGVDDVIDSDRTTTVTHLAASTDSGYNSFDVDDVMVTATDNDTAGLTFDPASVNVPEGSSSSYTVVLDTEPTDTVTVAITAGGDVSTNPTSLTFTTTDWNTAQTVTVNAAEDADGNNDSQTLAHAASGGEYDSVTGDVVVTVMDNDAPGVTVSESALTVDPEAGGTADYTVVLNTQPTAEVTITPESDDTSVALVSGVLTFTTMNWNTAQTVTVTGVNDNIDNVSDRTATVTHTIAGGGYDSVGVADVAVTATDDDTAGLTFDSAAVNVTEGGSSSYTVVLDTEPTVTVTVAITAGGDVSTNLTSLTFTTTDWNIAQTVTVNAAQDADGNNDSETLAHAASGGEYGSVTGTVMVTVIDDDAPNVTVTPVTVDVDEGGGTVDYTVVLNTQPTAEVTITPESDDPSVALVSGALTFTTTDWSTAQTVTVTGVNDNIDNPSDQRTTTVTHLAASMDSDYNSFDVDDVMVTATDNDTAGLTFDPAAVNVTEGDSSSYTVELNTEPTTTVTVAIPAVGDVTADPASLTFTTTDWNTAQTVTVTAAEDADGNNDIEMLAHTASGAEYDSVTDTVMVTVTDNDAPGVTVSESALTVDPEAGGTADYTVVLVTQPTADVTITPASDDTSVALVSGVLTFTTTDWNVAQTVTVTGVNDNIDNVSDRTATVTHAATSSDVDYEGVPVDPVMVTATDNDTAGLTFDPASVSVNEGGSSSYTVVLDTEPTVTVTVAITAGGDVSTNLTSLTFTTTDWNTAQTVTVNAAEDADGNNDSVTLAHAASGGEYDTVAGTVMVTVIDDDAPNVTVTPVTVDVDEAGGTVDYTVVLNTQPTAEVTITPASDDTSVALVSGALTFTTTDWNTAQTVTVTGVNDNIDNTGDERTTTVTHLAASTDSDYNSFDVDDVMVTATDDDTAGLTFDPASVNVLEGDSSSYTVELATEPTTTVTVAIPAVGDVTADPASLTFTTSNWNTAQTVTVTAVEDADGNNDIEMLAHTASGGEYDSVTDDVVVTVTDNDAPGVTVSESALTVDPEAGGTADYTVVLVTQPTADVTITPASDDTSVALVSGALTFTTTDWNTAQTVTVTGVNDDIDNTGDERITTVTHAATSSDVDYEGVPVAPVMVTANDDDTAGLTFDPASVNVLEGDSSSYTVELATEPTTTVTVAITAGGDVSTNPASLTFTTSDWNTAQTVTVTAAEDADGNNDSQTLAHAASGGEYGSVTGDVVVTVMDNDAPGVTVSESALTVDPEAGGTADYTVVLVTQPMADVTITPASDDTSVALVSGALTFTTTDWDTAQTVTVTGVDDDIDNTGDERITTVTHAATSSDVDYEGVPVAPVMVTANDDDTAGLTFDPASVSVNEGDSSSYTVELNTEPTVTVTVAITAGGDVTADPASLTFTTTDWNTAQTVMVTAAQDADGINDSQTLAHTASGGEYDSVTGTVVVTVIDDEVPGVRISTTTLTVPEGGPNTYTVRLNTQPTGDVVVTVNGASGDVSFSGSPLTFTTINWETEQTVTVNAAQDDDAAPDATVTLTHGVTGYGSITGGLDVVVTVTEDDTARVTVSPTTLTVFEKGGTVDYTVVLTTQPTGDVTITPASGDTSVATVSAALTFTTTDWNTPQTVTVTGMDDGIDNPSDRTATVSHTIAGGDYGSVPVADVAVTAIDANQTLVGFAYNPDEVVLNAPTPPTVTPPSGAQTPLTYSSTTSAVCTVNTDTGALTLVTAGDCNIEATASETPNFNEETVDFTVMVLPMVTLNPVAGNDIVNIEEHMAGFNISGMVSVGATEVSVTLGGGGGRDATVTDTNWTLLIPPNAPEIAGTSVEVVATATTLDGNTGTASRTIGVDLVAPTLVSATINGDILTLLYDEPLDGSFVPSTTTYTVDVVTPGTPLAVRHPVNTVSISGMTVTLMLFTAVTSNDAVILDYRPPGTDPVRDVDGNDAAMLMLDAETVINNTSAGLTPRQAKRLHEEILPQVAQAAAVNFTASMGERIDTVIGGAVLPAEGLWLDGQRIDGDKKAVLLGFLEKAPEYRLSIKEDTLNWKRMLGNSSFALNLAGENGAHSGASLWGSGYYTDFDSEVNADSDNEALKWDGGSFGFQIGADTRMTDNLLTGVAVSWVEGDMEYTLGSGDTRNEGDYTLTLTGIHPYVGWSDDDDRWSLWSSAGYAEGKVEIDPDEASRQKYDTSLVSIAGGFKRKLSDLFNIKGDFSVIEIDVDESHDVEDDRGLSIDSQRLRLLLEAKNKRTLADGGLLTHSGEIGYRVDKGDSETDSDGAELGASIDYHNPATNFTLAGKARALVGNGDHQDWGISGFIRLQPDRYGQGISFTLEPGYGNTSGSADDLWDRRPSPLPIERSDYSARMKAHLGYGLYGFVTPYTEISAEDALRRYRMGVRWQPGEFLDLNLFGEQSQGADTENALRLEGELRF